MFFDDGPHVVILVFDGNGDSAAAPFPVQRVSNLLDGVLLGLEFHRVVLAQQIPHLAVFHPAPDGVEMVESLITLRIDGLLPFGQHVLELAGNGRRIDHLSLRAARMDADTVDCNHRERRVECFVFQFSQSPAIHGIGDIGAEFRHIEIFRAGTHFLIGRESDPDFAVPGRPRGHEPFRQRHDFRDTGFVVRPEKGRPVRHDEPFSLQRRKIRECLRRHDDPGLPVQDETAAFIIHELRMDGASGDCVARVEMADEPDDRCTAHCGRHCGSDIPVGILLHILKAQCLELGRKLPSQIQLTRAGRIALGIIHGSRIGFDIRKESFRNFLHRKLSLS